ncbi:MAG: chemotaxis protein CheA [SAR324 cluster bacterium]|nr:chemotaxis protein CheA [SAR324 cluster bacterium]
MNDQEILQIFYEELDDLLEQIEADILAMESTEDPMALIHKIFRGVHTIKGGAGMCRWTGLAEFAHALENLLVQVRAAVIPVDATLIGLLLEALDGFNSLRKTGITPTVPARIQELKSQIQACLLSDRETASSSPVFAEKQPTPETPAVGGTGHSWLIELKLNQDSLRNGLEPLVVFRDLADLGELTVIPHISAVPSLEQLNPELLYLWWHVKLETTIAPEAMADAIKLILEGQSVVWTASRTPVEPENQKTLERSAGSLTSGKTRNIEKSGEIPPKESKEDNVLPEKNSTHDEKNSSRFLRVDITKLDKLINLVGESVINQSRLFQFHEQVEPLHQEMADQLLQVLDDNDRNVREMQDHVLLLRMVPIVHVFQPLQRLIRDFSAKAGKRIVLKMEGEHTEIDKTITEQISGSLKHLVRNSMDHGIEAPAVRQSRGKQPEGTISLKASHRDGYIWIEVSDDGQGLNQEKILQKALALGIINPNDKLQDEEIYAIICKPGFSTATNVTDVSGRGVGMDAVQKDIERLRGRLEIQSWPGRGTCFRIKLPLTLAITDGMLVSIGEMLFAIPLIAIVESLRPLPSQIKTVQQKHLLIEVRGEYIPLVRMSELFHLPSKYNNPESAMLVVVQDHGQKICMMVDQLVDQQQIVIKNLEENFARVPGIAGATILGDGQVSLIIDVPGVIRMAWKASSSPSVMAESVSLAG